jgi:hypothetical protein
LVLVVLAVLITGRLFQLTEVILSLAQLLLLAAVEGAITIRMAHLLAVQAVVVRVLHIHLEPLVIVRLQEVEMALKDIVVVMVLAEQLAVAVAGLVHRVSQVVAPKQVMVAVVVHQILLGLLSIILAVAVAGLTQVLQLTKD